METFVAWLVSINKDFTLFYHLFVAVEYTLVALYFMQIMKGVYKKVILYSIPVFAMISLTISHYLYNFTSMPGININSEGFLVCIISSYSLLNLPNANSYKPLTKHPDFWISVGWMVFFTGTFFIHGLYSYVRGLNREQALALFAMVNTPLNIILYSCLIIGFLCTVVRSSTSR